jgi:hypothetical protein
MTPAETSNTPIAEQLERMLQSEVFRTAARSSRLLRFLVEETVNGRADRLKDYTLGAEALGRGDNFDPRTDPIARVEASRLRSRLELYYATEGASDPIIITLPKGGYVPRFDHRLPSEPTTAAAPPARYRRGWLVVALVAAFAAGAATSWRISRWRHHRHPRCAWRLRRLRRRIRCRWPYHLMADNSYSSRAQGRCRVCGCGPFAGLASPLAGTEHASLPFWSPARQMMKGTAMLRAAYLACCMAAS